MHKYPRTFHLPWSPGLRNDDRKVETLETIFSAKSIVITEKLDGENTTMTPEICHARSLDSGPHPSRTVVRALHGEIKHMIPQGMRICGENMYAVHSIKYDALQSYFLVFNIWQNEICLSWEDTLEWCELLGLKTVPILWEGPPDPEIIHNFHRLIDPQTQEGFVIRAAGQFTLEDFQKNTVKWVRANHIQTDEHWMSKPIEKNLLKQN